MANVRCAIRLCGSLCLCGEDFPRLIHHRGTEFGQRFTEELPLLSQLHRRQRELEPMRIPPSAATHRALSSKLKRTLLFVHNRAMKTEVQISARSNWVALPDYRPPDTRLITARR